MLYSKLNDRLTIKIRKYTEAPSVYYMVISSESVICDYSIGFDDILKHKYVDQYSQFSLFSITKTFTATAILQLQENGKLDIDDMASKYLPNYSFLKDITIYRQLGNKIC
jgi:CubicO group peptidase (beta-lactamase class C family)